MNAVAPGVYTSLYRAQISSLIATAVDFGTLVSLVEVARVWYVAAVAAGAAVGAVTNFILGRHWSFSAAHQPAGGQALRYAFVSGVSLVLNSGGVFLLTNYLGIRYWLSRIFTGIVIGIGFNFTLHKNFVFKSRIAEE